MKSRNTKIQEKTKWGLYHRDKEKFACRESAIPWYCLLTAPMYQTHDNTENDIKHSIRDTRKWQMVKHFQPPVPIKCYSLNQTIG